MSGMKTPIKRRFEILVAGLMILSALPAFLLAWIGIKLTGGEKVFQVASGTLRTNGKPCLTLDCQPNAFGRFLQNYSIDLLPALFDVIAGKISLRDLGILSRRPTNEDR